VEQVDIIRKHALSLILVNIIQTEEGWNIGFARIVMRADTILAPVQNYIQRRLLSAKLEKHLVVHAHVLTVGLEVTMLGLAPY
jgi:hypothetical protein